MVLSPQARSFASLMEFNAIIATLYCGFTTTHAMNFCVVSLFRSGGDLLPGYFPCQLIDGWSFRWMVIGFGS
jgi:hypothetical protein